MPAGSAEGRGSSESTARSAVQTAASQETARTRAGLCPRGHVFGNDLLDDFRNFLFVGFRRILGADPTPLQYDIADWIQSGPDLRMAQAGRGTGKSRITQMYVPWRLLREWHYSEGSPDFHAMIISANKDLADGASYFIQQLLHVVPECRVLLPEEGSNARWSAYGFDVQGARPHPLPTVFSRGIFSRITGDRANLIVPDDIEIPSNAETQIMRDKLRERGAEFFDLLVPEGGEIAALGTPQTEDTLYQYFRQWGYALRIWPAEYVAPERDEEIYGGNLAPSLKRAVGVDPSLVGTPTEPTRFGPEELDQRRKSSKARYALQYLLDTTLSDVDKYPLRLSDLIVMELDDNVGPERPIWSGSAEHVRKDLVSVGMGSDCFHGPMGIVENRYVPYDYKVMFVDPSGKGKDETAFAVIGCIGGYLYLLACGGYLEGYTDATMLSLVDTAESLRVQNIVVEPNMGGGTFAAVLRRHIADRLLERSRGSRPSLPGGDEPWIGASVSEGKPRVVRKESRIIDTLEPVMNQHRLVVSSSVVERDRARPGQHGDNYRLFHQMTRIHNVKGALLHDDRLDALAGAVEECIERMHVQQDVVAQKRQDEIEKADWDRYWDTNFDTLVGLAAQPREPRITDSIATVGRVNPLLPRGR